MSFFKRKDKNLIPPVQSDSPTGTSRSTSPGPPSYRSTASTYNRSRDGPDLYNVPNPKTPSYSSPVSPDSGDPHYGSSSAPKPDSNRNELFSGYQPQAGSGSGRFFDGPAIGREPPPGEENDEDVEGIKQQTRFIKQDSVNSTRNALRMAREAEETARNTLGRLGDQSEKMANTERHLDVAKGHTVRAEDKIDELKKLNRSIFRPAITFNKDAKRAAQEAKLQQRYEDERNEREKAMMDIRDTQNRLGRAATYGAQDDEELPGTSGSGRFRTEAQLAARKEQRKRYQYEAGASDDEMEDELDDNLDEISRLTKNLKTMGVTMGQELDQQNDRIGRIDQKTTSLDNKVFTNTGRLNRIK
ncbi:hypothetical protein CONPUDRAFT_115278 [Coniophora puteana RWD-64-598 SS2]|uniref:t-SNARE coiled-coil homology domain-containing protein n=1 Tax=Coniophora puteana (strain RWD-64-598) TaxID=741705 RepID=A0A5M3N5T4_CONPW|nr:uncharacterized protein CONPUDRAFT_115278 [Coniophora puteana RWD-64-598 SS2]EIW86678.1 hypothetical protein CONPUDRAFT_115278 [Coniophora puteana RWD-64-598 SS2]